MMGSETMLNSAQVKESLLKAYSKRLFWFIVGINFLNYLDRYTLPAVLEPLGVSLSLNDEQRGFLGSVFLLSYMCAAPLFGILGDKFRRPRVIAIGILVWSLATLCSAFVRNFHDLVLLRALVGVGEAAYYGLGVAMLCDIVPERERPSKLTYFFLAIPLGSAIGFGLAGTLAQMFGWRTAFLVAGLPGIVISVAMWFVRDPERGVNDSFSDEAKGLSFSGKMKLLFSNRFWIVATACYAAYSFAMGALTHWGAAFLERAHGFATSHSGLLLGGITALAGIVGTFAGGFVVQRWQQRFVNIDVWFSAITLFLGALGIAYFLQGEGGITLLAVLLVSMTLLFANTTPVNNITVTPLPASIRAWGASVNVFLIHAFGDAVSPSAVGILSDFGGGSGRALGNALMLTVPAFMAGAFVLIFARRKKTTF
jgi:predicted MFS family arabinose efflux permease